ncbi:MAG: reprolysin-like metallopeptidase [Acidobacteriota bacterium]
MSDAYKPSQSNVAEVKVFSPPLTGLALSKLQAERPADLPAVGTYPVEINMAQLRALPLNSEVELNLPDGRTLSLVHDSGSISQAGNYTFVGYVRDRGTDHRVIMTTGAQGETFGVLNLPEGEVRVESRKGQTWLVDTKKAGISYAPMAEPLMPRPQMAAYKAQSGSKDLAQAAGSTTSGSSVAIGTVAAAAPEDTTVDLMVVYTPGMVNRLGGDAQARTRIDNLVAVTNQIMVDSQVPIRMRLVRTLFVNQDDNVNQGNLLSAIASGSGAFANVKAERDASGADLVHLLHKPTVGVGSCGIAYLSVTQGPRGNEGSGYGVTDDSCPTMVMAHELGHNFGNNHDHAQGGGSPVYPYAWGYIVPGTNLGDVMSYAGQHYYKYSNPRLSGCANQICGQNDYADAARSMSQTRTIVAGYRATQVGGGEVASLNPGQAIYSGNGRYRLTYQTDGNLVAYAGSVPLWASGTVGRGVGRAVMQGDGNLVVYNAANQPLWASGTWGNPGSTLAVQDDGNIVIYRANHTPSWATNTVQNPSILLRGQAINPGQSVFSSNGRYQLVYQTDGNLVIYNGVRQPVWASGTMGRGVGRTVMQDDGNLVIYNSAGQPLWASGTWGNPGSFLAVQDDGNVVIYRSNRTPSWASNTVGR